MKAFEVTEQLDKLSEEQRDAICALIDIKAGSGTDKVLHRLDCMQNSIDTKFDSLMSKIETLDAKLDYNYQSISRLLSTHIIMISIVTAFIGVLLIASA